ncbi:MAG: sigma-70 family RNA polymerase sigma factor, partial [Acidimicrobiales bacterium]
SGWASYEEALRTHAQWDRGVERFHEFDEAVIWCEHDLFDQLLLARHLAWFADRELGATVLSLICIGEYPGRPAFKGLGELTAPELGALFPTRRPVTRQQLELGRRAWAAFTAPDPRAVERFLAEGDTAALPFLAGALRRHLEEFPSVPNGLSRTEAQILELVAAGTTELRSLFPAVHARETQFYIADASFVERLRRLAGGPHALLRLDEGPRWREGRAALTDVGRRVLGGRDDWVRLSGIDRWLGGVHLAGAEAQWRWDAAAGRLSKT